MRARVNRGLTIILVTALLSCLVIFTRRSGSKSDDLSNISWSSFKMSLPESPSFLNFIRDAGDIDDVPEQPHHHNDLYDRDLTVVNITKFKFLINNDICNVSKIHMVSIIHTAGPNVDARQMIRESWGRPNIPGVVTRLVFLLGSTSDSDLQTVITEENEKNHDIVQGDFVDHYRNLSYKAIMGKLWVSEFCEQAEFVVKTDDDIFVDMFEVYSYTRPFLTSPHYKSDRFLLCPVWRGLPILRDVNNKWYASYEDIPLEGKPGEQCYPTDCSGWLWITSPGTSGAIAEAAQQVKFFWIDDVWVTGYIAGHLNIEHQDCIKYWTMRGDQLLLYKSLQNPHHYCPDFMSGPMNRDKDLTVALQRRARWNYFNKANNNVYNSNFTEESLEKEDLLFPDTIKRYFPFN